MKGKHTGRQTSNRILTASERYTASFGFFRTFLTIFPPTQGNQEECRNQRAAFPGCHKILTWQLAKSWVITFKWLPSREALRPSAKKSPWSLLALCPPCRQQTMSCAVSKSPCLEGRHSLLSSTRFDIISKTRAGCSRRTLTSLSMVSASSPIARVWKCIYCNHKDVQIYL